MKTNNKVSTKLSYQEPTISSILLDNEISLALESAPPEGPNEFYSFNSEHDVLNQNKELLV